MRKFKAIIAAVVLGLTSMAALTSCSSSKGNVKLSGTSGFGHFDIDNKCPSNSKYHCEGVWCYKTSGSVANGMCDHCGNSYTFTKKDGAWYYSKD